MKKSLTLVIYILLIFAWIALGAFSLYFSEYAVFKICSFIFLSGLSYLIFQHVNILGSKFKITFFKKKLFLTIKAVLVLFIFCLLHFLNTQQKWTLDLTLQKLYQVRKASIELVKTLTKDNKLIMTFWGTREQWNQYEDLLLSYKNASNNVQLNWINPDKNPELAIQIQGRELPQLSIEYGAKKQWVDTLDEWLISVTLNTLKEKNNKLVCFLSTHQTIPIDSVAEDGLSEFKKVLQSEGFSIQYIDLNSMLEAKTCQAVLIVGPKDDFLVSEIKMLTELAKMLPLILAITPSVDKKYLFNLRQWINQLGVSSIGSPVIDQSVLQFGEQAINVLWTNQQHDIDSNWSNLALVKGRVLFQLTTAFDLSKSSQSKITPIIYTQAYPSTWQEANWDGVIAGKVTFNDESDKKGPLPILVSLESSQIHQLILVGTDRLWINGLKNYPANFNLGVNLIKTLVKDTVTSSASSIVLRDEKLFLHNSQAKLVFYLSIVVMPILMLLFAFLIFRKNTQSQ
jgi:hypothetical protein